jgi:hypothetical protein
MSMPKGFKTANGYATVSKTDGGLDYRSIAEKMTGEGDKMNHATARNIFLRAMKKLATPIHEMYDLEADEISITKTAKDPRFQESISEIMDSNIQIDTIDV